MRSTTERFVVDGNVLTGGLVVPTEPRGIVLLLHGIPSVNPPDPDDAGYPGLAEAFAARGWAAAYVNLRGVRDSAGTFSMEGWVRDLAAVIGSLREDGRWEGLPFVVVGSSAGGAVATVAARRGARIDALALLGTPAAWVSFAGDAADAVRRITQEAGMALAPEVLADPLLWASEFEDVCTEDAAEDLRIPLLIVHGSADDVVPVDHAQRIASKVTGAKLAIIDGVGHQLRRDPQALEIVFDWLEEVAG
jgi:pimeloyl-ACP methyl ester carboxylesterase